MDTNNSGDPDRDDRDADHLDQDEEPEQPVVGVEGRGEPRKTEPRPDRGEVMKTYPMIAVR